MTTTITKLHERTTHIDAPVETVFEYMKDPQHFLLAFPEKDRAHMALAEFTETPEGVGSTYRIMGRTLLLFHMEWNVTREEYVPNQRIVDRAGPGGVWTSTFEPDETGTKLSLAFGWAGRFSFVGETMDRFSWDGDRDLDLMLASIKKAIEA
jgi:uncharacterized protein YndB with AHSA1/START domain